jgi:adenosine kinase
MNKKNLIETSPTSNVAVAQPSPTHSTSSGLARRGRNTTKYTRVVVTGSIAYDHIMNMPGKFSDHIMPDKIHMLNVSFIMQDFRREFGGTGGNIAYSLGLLEIPTLLVGSAGSDFKNYQQHLANLKSLDASLVKIYKDRTSATGFVMTDKDDNQIWGFYEGAMKYEDDIDLEKIIKPSDFLMVCPTNPKAMIKFAKTARKMGVDYLFDPAFNIAHMGAEDLRQAVMGAKILIGNDYEMELIRRRLNLNSNKELVKDRIVVTTLGSKGSEIQVGERKYQVGIAKVKAAVDPTGAGDAYRAGLVSGWLQGMDWQECGQWGAVVSAYTVENYGTQTHRFTVGEFRKRYEENFGK